MLAYLKSFVKWIPKYGGNVIALNEVSLKEHNLIGDLNDVFTKKAVLIDNLDHIEVEIIDLANYDASTKDNTKVDILEDALKVDNTKEIASKVVALKVDTKAVDLTVKNIS